jgi:hypothetical protein
MKFKLSSLMFWKKKKVVIVNTPHINEKGECTDGDGFYKCRYSTHHIGKKWTNYICPVHAKMSKEELDKLDAK